MILKECMLTRNDCYQKASKMTGGKPTGIVVHSTGANNPTLRRYVQPLRSDERYGEIIDDIGVNLNNNHWNKSYKARETTRQVCVHAFIGKNEKGTIETYQTLPFDYCCWGCASGRHGSYNRNPNARVQFEICEDGLNDERYFKDVFREAIEFCAYLCERYGMSADRICSHREAHIAGYGNNHGDCDHWLAKFGKTMDWFRAEVQKKLDGKGKDGDGGEKESDKESGIRAGDLVVIKSGATYYSGKPVPNWVLSQRWYVESVAGERAVINKSESGMNAIRSGIHVDNLSVVSQQKEEAIEREPEKAETAKRDMGEAEIWSFLMKEYENEFGVAGLMGNLKAESNLQANNLQNTYEKRLGMTDESYTEAVDSGTYDNFINDRAGYGLAQWTHYSRKEKLLKFAREKGTSIGDMGMQLAFVVKEIGGEVEKGIRTATSVEEASDLVMVGYENPADKSEKAKERRRKLAIAFYEKYSSGKEIDHEKIEEIKKEYERAYKVKVTTGALNIRDGANMSANKVGVIRDKGVYTIVDDIVDASGIRWGKLKSGEGWIHLGYTRKL